MRNFFSVWRTFETEGDVEDLEDKLLVGGASFYARRQNEYAIECRLKASLGVALINGFKSYPIGTDVMIFRDANDKIHVEMRSGMRGEIAFLFLMWFAIAIASVASDEKNLWIAAAVFPMLIVWFQFLYRSQQQILQKSVETHLKSS